MENQSDKNRAPAAQKKGAFHHYNAIVLAFPVAMIAVVLHMYPAHKEKAAFITGCVASGQKMEQCESELSSIVEKAGKCFENMANEKQCKTELEANMSAYSKK